jgi:hypothetical protein
MSAAMTLAEPSDVRPLGEGAAGLPESVNTALEEQLRAALRRGRYMPYDRQTRADCFLFGALCAKAGLGLPHWMNDAALWAHEAALRGYSAFSNRRASALQIDAAECSSGMSAAPSPHPARATAEPHPISGS